MAGKISQTRFLEHFVYVLIERMIVDGNDEEEEEEEMKKKKRQMVRRDKSLVYSYKSLKFLI